MAAKGLGSEWGVERLLGTATEMTTAWASAANAGANASALEEPAGLGEGPAV